MTSGSLQFDKMTVDTTEAENYLKIMNKEFHCDGSEENGNFVLDSVNNKIYETTTVRSPTYGPLGDKSKFCFSNLIEEINKNTKLFCQLEYMIRQVPIETTKLHLVMIVKNLYNSISHMDQQNPEIFLHPSQAYQFDSKSNYLVMRDDSPLIDLGCIVLLPSANIIASRNTAAVCFLFMRICRTSGLNQVSIAFPANIKNWDDKSGISKNKVLEGGCVGVVTAKADLDSAVDALLAAPKGDVWGLRSILVQESVCDRFQKAVSWKAKPCNNPDMTSVCHDAYQYGDRVFVYEYAGAASSVPNVVLIEAFRTVKELMSLVKEKSPFCLSLWSSDVAESTEVALGAGAPLVWVNDYGALGESLAIADAYFSQTSRRKQRQLPCDDPMFAEVYKLQRDWAKLSVAQRFDKLLAVCARDLKGEEEEYGVSCLLQALRESSSNDFVHISSNTVVYGIKIPSAIYTVQWKKEHLKCFFARLLRGSGHLVRLSDASEGSGSASLAAALATSAAPVRVTEAEYSFDDLPTRDRMRFIHTSYGTMFAN